MSVPVGTGWAVIVPVKSTARGKSRIDLPAADRQSLAEAMAHDTLRAVAATTSVVRVLAVLESTEDMDMLADLPSVTPWQTTVVGMNTAIRAGRDRLVAGGWTGPVAVVPADLPGLEPTGLDRALRTATRFRRTVLADAEGVGTTLLTALVAAELTPAFGGSSHARHLAAGAVDLPLGPEVGLRRDMDRVADLVAAARDGRLGERTTEVVARVITVARCG